MPPNQAVDIIATKILIDAKGATETLKAFSKEVTTAQAKLTAIKQLISAVSRQMNGDLKGATAAVQRFSKALDVNPAAIRSVGNELRNVGQASQQAGKAAEGSFARLTAGANIARIAIGTLVAQGLFLLQQAVVSVFQSAIEQATDFEATLYRIQNVERQLSLEGIEVSTAGLLKGIKDIQAALPIFSKEDVAELVGSIAITTKELGYTEDQILKLAAATAILNVNSAEEETLLQTQAKITNSLVSPMAKSIGNLGLSFGKAKIEAKGFELGILQVGEKFDDLTEKEKSEIKFNIVLETAGIEGVDDIEQLRTMIQEAGGDFAALDQYLDSNAAKLEMNKAAWSDLLKTFGEVIVPFVPGVTSLFETLQDSLNGIKIILIEFLTLIGTLGVATKAVLSGSIKSWDDYKNVIKEARDLLLTDLTNTFFKETPEGASDFITENYLNRIKPTAETATAAIEDMNEAAEENEDAQNALQELDEKIQDIIIDAKQAKEDLDIKLEQKQQDLDTEYNRKAEDAARDHADKLQDIDTNARQKAEDAKRKAREDEKKAERDLLQKLKELRERFLLDLEDALRERDARQVLRLIKEYKLEKQNILDRKKLDDQERKERLAEELRNIEIERQRKIEQEQIDYQRKLADLALQKQREQEELALWYQREQEDIQRNIEQKLEKLLAGYIAEETLTEEHQGAITAILAKHFGNNMALVDQMVAYMQSRFAQMGQLAAAGLQGYTGSNPGLLAAKNLQVTNPTAPRRYAEGGTHIADRPTTVTFGEAGLEMAQFTPLGRNGKDVNKIFGDLGGAMGGSLQLGIMLSPDLRAEIINTTMDKVALNIEHTRRERR